MPEVQREGDCVSPYIRSSRFPEKGKTSFGYNLRQSNGCRDASGRAKKSYWIFRSQAEGTVEKANGRRGREKVESLLRGTDLVSSMIEQVYDNSYSTQEDSWTKWQAD